MVDQGKYSKRSTGNSHTFSIIAAWHLWSYAHAMVRNFILEPVLTAPSKIVHLKKHRFLTIDTFPIFENIVGIFLPIIPLSQKRIDQNKHKTLAQRGENGVRLFVEKAEESSLLTPNPFKPGERWWFIMLHLGKPQLTEGEKPFGLSGLNLI